VLGSDIPIEGASVQFTTGDGGSFSAASVVTDATGRAQTMWTLGPRLGTQTTTATVSGFSSVQTTFTATAAAGVTVSWNNAAGGSWSDPANWTPNQVPNAGDTVVIDLDGVYTVTLGANATVAALNLGGASGLQTLALSSSVLTLNGDATIGVTGAVDLTGANIAGSGSLFSAGVVRVISGVAVLDLGFTNSGSLDVQGGGLEITSGGTSTGMINTATGTSTSVSGGTVETTGGSVTLNGSLAVLTGATVRFNGGTHSFSASSSVSGAGTIDFAGGTATVVGSYSVSGTSTEISGGTVFFQNTTTPATMTTLRMTGGIMDGPGDVQISSLLEWSGGMMTGGGRTVVTASATGQFSGIAGRTLAARTLDNQGAITWTAGGFTVNNGTVIQNASAASIDIQGDLVWGWTGGAEPSLVNDGTLRRSAGTGTTTIDFGVVNNGTLDVQTGTVDLNTSLTHADGAVLQGSGTLDLADATVNAFDGDVSPGTSPGALGVIGDLGVSPLATINLELNGTTAGSQYDQLNLSGSGTFTLDGTLNITAGFTPQVGDQFTVLQFVRRGAGAVTAVNGLDLGGGVVLDTVWGLTNLVLVVPAPQIIFAGDSSGGLSTGIFTVNPDGTALINPIPMTSLGYQRQFPRWSPDRNRMAYSWDGGVFGPLQLYVASKTGGSVQVVVTDTSTFRPRWSPNGMHLAFECGNGFSIVDVCVIGDVTGAIGALPVNTYAIVSGAGGLPPAWQGGQSGFSWDPQNPSRLVFSRDSTGVETVSMLWTAAYDGSGVLRLAPDGLLRPSDSAPLIVYGPLDYSPDGQQIVFAAYSPVDAIPEEKLFVINRDGTGLRQLTFLPGYDDSPLFSPDGTEVAFGRDLCASTGAYDGWIVDLANTDGTLERRITDHGGVTCDFDTDLLGGDWSPDGSEIVLSGFDATGNLLIYVVPRTVLAATYPSLRVLVGRGVDLGGFVQDIQPSWRP
jgi:hypothetical protein